MCKTMDDNLQDDELNVNEIKAALDFLESSASHGKIDCKMVLRLISTIYCWKDKTPF